MKQKKTNNKIEKGHVAQRDVANQKVLNLHCTMHCIHGDNHRSITACFIYYSARQLSKDSTQDISREFYQVGVFSPLSKKDYSPNTFP